MNFFCNLVLASPPYSQTSLIKNDFSKHSEAVSRQYNSFIALQNAPTFCIFSSLNLRWRYQPTSTIPQYTSLRPFGNIAKDKQKREFNDNRLTTKSKFYLLSLLQWDKEFDARIKQFYHYPRFGWFLMTVFFRIVVTQAIILVFKAFQRFDYAFLYSVTY